MPQRLANEFCEVLYLISLSLGVGRRTRDAVEIGRGTVLVLTGGGAGAGIKIEDETVMKGMGEGGPVLTPGSEIVTDTETGKGSGEGLVVGAGEMELLWFDCCTFKSLCYLHA